MNGDPAAPSIAAIWAFGGREFDAKGALRSLVHAAEVPTAEDLSHNGCPVGCVGQRPGLDQYLKLHYIPIGAPAWGASADTLEDATADFSLSALAGHLRDRAVQKRFLARAQYWRNLWNPKAAPDGGYVMNRNADGSWPATDVDEDNDSDGTRKPFTPSTGAGFVEGSAAQYVWMVPFNVAGLFQQMGGRETATARLDRFFYQDGKPAVTRSGPTHAELDNEPSIGTPWLYDYARQPWKTQQLVRQVLNTLWLPEPKGLPGNDDLGEMSSWAVFAYLGVYPAIPGRAELVLGSPSFPRAVVHRAAGDVTITAPAATAAELLCAGPEGERQGGRQDLSAGGLCETGRHARFRAWAFAQSELGQPCRRRSHRHSRRMARSSRTDDCRAVRSVCLRRRCTHGCFQRGTGGDAGKTKELPSWVPCGGRLLCATWAGAEETPVSRPKNTVIG